MIKNCFYTFLLIVSSILCGDELWEDFSRPETFQVQNGAKISIEKGPKSGMNALYIRMPGAVRKEFPAPKKESDARNRSKGIQFRIKGDGSQNYGSIAVWENRGFTYVYLFPLKDTDWKTYNIAWEDFWYKGTPITYDPRPLPDTGVAPGGLIGFEFSSMKPFDRKSPAHYSIADLKFTDDAKPLFPKEKRKPAPLSHILEKAKNDKQINIVCWGSFSSSFAEMLKKELGKRTKDLNADIQIISGDAKCETDALNLIQLSGRPCDLLIYMPRGQQEKLLALPAEVFEEMLNHFSDRFAKLTDGKSALLMIPPLPGTGNRRTFMDAYENALFSAAKKSGFEPVPYSSEFKNNREKLMGVTEHSQLNTQGIMCITQILADKLQLK